MDHGGANRRKGGLLAHHEALAGIDDEGLRGRDRLVGRAGQDEAIFDERVDDHLEDPVETAAGFSDGEVLIVDDAVTSVGRDLRDRGGRERDRRIGRRGGHAEGDAEVVDDGGDVSAGRDARAGDRLAHHEAGGARERHGRAGVGGRGAGDGDGREGDVAGRIAQAGDGGTGVDAVAPQHLAHAHAQDVVDLDIPRTQGGGARDALGGVESDARKADAVGQHPQIGRILIGEGDRGRVADGEGTTAGAAELDDAGLQLHESAEIIGQSAGAEREHAVAGLGNALESVDRRRDQEALGRVEGVLVVEDARRPAEGVVRDDELAGGRTQGAALDDGDRAGRHGDAGPGSDRGTVDEEGAGVDDLRHAGAGRQAGAGDRHARDEAGGAGDADREGTEGGRAAGQAEVRGGRGGGLEDAAGNHLEDAAVRDGQERGARGVEAHADGRDDVEQRAGIPGGVRDVLAVEHARKRVTRSHGHGDDIGADARGETGRARGVGDRDGGAEGAHAPGEEVVAGGGRDAVDGALHARGQGEADGTAESLRDRSEIKDQVASAGGEEVEGGVAARVDRGSGRQGQSGGVLADIKASVTQERDAAAA